MKNYETIFVLSPELGSDAVAEQQNFYKDNIVKNGGEISSVELLGKLTLAYKIGRFSEGIYTLMQFKAKGDYVPELERRYKYNELVLRYAVVMLDEKKFKAKPRKDPVKREKKAKRPEEESLEFIAETESELEEEQQ